MPHYAVITAVGADQPGLVDALSKYILECGCNIEDSRMAVLGGEFAMILLAVGEAPASLEKLQRGAGEAGAQAGLNVHVKRTGGRGEATPGGAVPYEIAAYSMDHPGIVQRISHFLAGHRINIRTLETRVTHAPTTGLPLFSLHATVDVPARERVAEIRRGLEAIGADENLDIEVKPAKE